MKIAYFGYDFFYSCLELIHSQGHEIIKIYVPDCDNKKYLFNKRILGFAENFGIPTVESRKPSHDDLNKLTLEGCDLVVAAAYDHKIPTGEATPRGINIHPSLLPEGRGRWPLPRIILENLLYSGVTIHKLTQEWDSGDILIQDKFSISSDETLESLSCKVQILAASLLSHFLLNIDKVWSNARPQFGGSYWQMPTLEERTLNWTLPVEHIKRISRAFGKFNSFAIFDDAEWIIDDLSVWEENHALTPGSVVHRTNTEVVIAAIDGFVCLRFFDLDPDFVSCVQNKISTVFSDKLWLSNAEIVVRKGPFFK